MTNLKKEAVPATQTAPESFLAAERVQNSGHMTSKRSAHVYEVRPRKDHRGVDLISDALPFGGLWYTKPDDAVEYAEFYSRSHPVVMRVYDEAGNVIDTH